MYKGDVQYLGSSTTSNTDAAGLATTNYLQGTFFSLPFSYPLTFALSPIQCYPITSSLLTTPRLRPTPHLPRMDLLRRPNLRSQLRPPQHLQPGHRLLLPKLQVLLDRRALLPSQDRCSLKRHVVYFVERRHGRHELQYPCWHVGEWTQGCGERAEDGL